MRQRETHRELGAAPGARAPSVGRPVVELDEAAHQREAEPEPTARPRERLDGLLEGLEHGSIVAGSIPTPVSRTRSIARPQSVTSTTSMRPPGGVTHGRVAVDLWSSSAYRIERPRLARAQRLVRPAELGVRGGEGGLVLLVRVDVRAGAEPAEELARFAAHRERAHEEPAEGTVIGAPDPVLDLVGRPARDALLRARRGPIPVLGVEDPKPALVGRVLDGRAGVLAPVPVVEHRAAVRPRDPDELRHRLGELAELLLAERVRGAPCIEGRAASGMAASCLGRTHASRHACGRARAEPEGAPSSRSGSTTRACPILWHPARVSSSPGTRLPTPRGARASTPSRWRRGVWAAISARARVPILSRREAP